MVGQNWDTLEAIQVVRNLNYEALIYLFLYSFCIQKFCNRFSKEKKTHDATAWESWKYTNIVSEKLQSVLVNCFIDYA